MAGPTNDTRGWVLVRDRIRATVAEAIAGPADRALMLGRRPPPVRLIGERVFVPRYRRLVSQRPGGAR